MLWAKPSVSGSGPSARCAHSCTLFCSPNSNPTSNNGPSSPNSQSSTIKCFVNCSPSTNYSLYIFGGWNGQKMLNDLHIFSCNDLSWNTPRTKGPVPGLRAGHTMTAVKNNLFVFGGGDGHHYLNDLHILDTESMTWSQAYVAGTSPSARSRHTTTLIDSKLFVFGGGEESRVFNDLYSLDTETMAWFRHEMRGVIPCGRWGHAATECNGKLIIFGGHNGREMLNDTYILDIQTFTWSQLVSQGESSQRHLRPFPRAGHTLTAISRNSIVLFGGGDGHRILSDGWVLDLETGVWTQQTFGGSVPSARCAHSATLVNDTLVVFGGGDGGKRFRDLYVLELAPLLKIEEDRLSKNQPLLQSVSNQSVLDIGKWLTDLGFAKYVDSFLQQEITPEVLPMLTELHLEKLGVSTIGARLTLLNAIQKLQKHEDSSPHNTKRNGRNLRHSQDREQEPLKQSLEVLTLSTNTLAAVIREFSLQKQPILPTSSTPSNHLRLSKSNSAEKKKE